MYKHKTHLTACDQSISDVEAGADVLLQGRLSLGIIFNVIGLLLLRELSETNVHHIYKRRNTEKSKGHRDIDK